MITKAQAAKAMGMKEREVADVARRPGGGFRVTTFDNQQTDLLPDGPPRPAPKLAAVGVPAEPPADVDQLPPKPAKKTTKSTPRKTTKGRGKQAGDQPDGGQDQEPADVYPADQDEAERLAWVGDDPARAAAAAEYETGRDTPDEALLAKLQAIVEAPAG